ncbi:hypothetical protein Tco_0040210 [Tanacetum coccineum]
MREAKILLIADSTAADYSDLDFVNQTQQREMGSTTGTCPRHTAGQVSDLQGQVKTLQGHVTTVTGTAGTSWRSAQPEAARGGLVAFLRLELCYG